MIATLPEMRALTHELTVSVWSLAAVGVLFESGLVEHLREPHSVDDLATKCPSLPRSRLERCLALGAATGVVSADGGRYRLADGAMPFVEQPLRASMNGDIRAHLMQALAFLDSSKGPTPVTGWRHTDRALLEAQGNASAALPPMFKANIVAGLGDLAERLDRPGARFLDIGVGVAALAIGMCRAWPELRVVGLDTFDAPLAFARENVARANLADRIELRKLAVEDLSDEESFELAWLPAFFISEQVLARATARVRAALRPAGWVLLPLIGVAGDERQRAVGALVTDLWGGPALSIAGAEALLKDAGFTSVRALTGPPWAPAMVVGQR
jgi:hypothetical protein